MQLPDLTREEHGRKGESAVSVAPFSEVTGTDGPAGWFPHTSKKEKGTREKFNHKNPTQRLTLHLAAQRTQKPLPAQGLALGEWDLHEPPICLWMTPLLFIPFESVYDGGDNTPQSPRGIMGRQQVT